MMYFARMATVVLLCSIGSFAHGEAADDALGGRELFALSAVSVGLQKDVDGIKKLQMELERAFPVGTQLSEVMKEVSMALNRLQMNAGLGVTIQIYSSCVLVEAKKALGAGDARSTVSFEFDERSQLHRVYVFSSFEASDRSRAWPRGTRGVTAPRIVGSQSRDRQSEHEIGTR